MVPSTPTPSPASTPTPTPASSTQNLLNLSANTNLEGFAGSNGYYRARNDTITGVEDLGIAATTPVMYDAFSHTFLYRSFDYLLPNNPNSGNVSLSYNASASSAGYSTYTGQANGTSYSFTQLTPGATNSVLPLIYTSIAVAKASFVESSTGITDHGVTPMAFGILFNWDTTHLTGSGDYTGVILGQARGKGSTHAYDITGTINLNINYDTTNFSGQLHLIATDDKTGTAFDLGTVTLSNISPRGVLDYFYADVTGSDLLQGRLGGPLGQEFVAGFDAHFPDPQASGVTMKVSAALAAKK